MRNKCENLFWGKGTGEKIVDSAKTGAKIVIGVAIAGLALGLGLGAMNSVSGN